MMTNEVSFGQRIVSSWRELVGWIDNVGSTLPEDEAPLAARLAYRKALLILGRRALQCDHRSTFLHEGGLATISACIDAGIVERDEIVTTAGRHHTASRRHIGYLLGEYTGADPEHSLWGRGSDRLYSLLPFNH